MGKHKKKAQLEETWEGDYYKVKTKGKNRYITNKLKKVNTKEQKAKELDEILKKSQQLNELQNSYKPHEK